MKKVKEKAAKRKAKKKKAVKKQKKVGKSKAKKVKGKRKMPAIPPSLPPMNDMGIDDIVDTPNESYAPEQSDLDSSGEDDEGYF